MNTFQAVIDAGSKIADVLQVCIEDDRIFLKIAHYHPSEDRPVSRWVNIAELNLDQDVARKVKSLSNGIYVVRDAMGDHVRSMWVTGSDKEQTNQNTTVDERADK